MMSSGDPALAEPQEVKVEDLVCNKYWYRTVLTLVSVQEIRFLCVPVIMHAA